MSSRPVIAGFGALGLFWGAWASLLPSVQRATGAGLARQAGAGREPILLCIAAAIVAIGLANRGPGPSGTPGEAGLRFSRALAVLGVVALIAFVVEGGLESWSALFLERDLAA